MCMYMCPNEKVKNVGLSICKDGFVNTLYCTIWFDFYPGIHFTFFSCPLSSPFESDDQFTKIMANLINTYNSLEFFIYEVPIIIVSKFRFGHICEL